MTLMDQIEKFFSDPIPPEPVSDREELQRDLDEMPEKASPKTIAALESELAALDSNDWEPECGCRFESIFSSAVSLCEGCSKLPCHQQT